MAVYQYRGRDRKGEKKSGKLKAHDEKEAIEKLRELGVAVISLEELTSFLYKEIEITKKKVRPQDFVMYIRQFSTLIQAGISIVEATQILAKQTDNKLLKQSLSDIEEKLREGRSFTQAVSEHPKIFPPMFVHLIRAGEVGGNMDEILDRLAVYFEKQYETRNKVKAALTYPVFIGIVSITVLIFLLTTVVPTFSTMFASLGAELPFVTKMVLSASQFFLKWWWFILLIVGATTAGIWYFIKSEDGQYYFDYFALKLPIVGMILRKFALARMTRTLSSLYASSVPILQSMSIIENVVGNEVYVRALQDVKRSLEKGQSMTKPLQEHWAFPPMVVQMIATGEKTGAMETVLGKVADFYEADVSIATEKLKALLEPVLITFLAGVVGVIVASIALPMFSVFESIQ
ncbi:type IV pilus assembly protein PilC [Bacillus oleivorans]|uniref:Type IV pilus assembly protein PilC n=1 Tax=Bacillus oleivorans TaxID=1448271 RepID=A0A285CVI6_9BACI|nr:type II secretion system F family protein [Bacillus oleivorans]SNX71544.1 type IV pilus assembly protein PilC [Bacillus oleivorans]